MAPLKESIGDLGTEGFGLEGFWCCLKHLRMLRVQGVGF